MTSENTNTQKAEVYCSAYIKGLGNADIQRQKTEQCLPKDWSGSRYGLQISLREMFQRMEMFINWFVLMWHNSVNLLKVIQLYAHSQWMNFILYKLYLRKQ